MEIVKLMWAGGFFFFVLILLFVWSKATIIRRRVDSLLPVLDRSAALKSQTAASHESPSVKTESEG